MKKLIIFDLDGTISESKSPIDEYMASLLDKLLKITKVAIISGGNWNQFQNQILEKLGEKVNLKNLSLLPTCGTKFYQFQSIWNVLYVKNFTKVEKKEIIDSIQHAMIKTGFKAKETWGDVIEDRGSQITFSGLGQLAPIAKKIKWDPNFSKRKEMKVILDSLLPKFSVRLGGTTSIDITKKGIDKAYGIKKLSHVLKMPINEMIFIGDAIFEGGNDFPIKNTGVNCIQVNNPLETKLVIETIINLYKKN